MVGRQTPILALIVPLILVGMVDGMRGIRQAWPAAVVGGLAFAIGQFVCSNYISVELTDIVASLLSAGAIVALVQVWQPAEPLRGESRRGRAGDRGRRGRRPGHEAEVRRKEATTTTPRPRSSPPSRRTCSSSSSSRSPSGADQGLPRRAHVRVHVARARRPQRQGRGRLVVTYKFNWANAAGTLLLVAGC
jgi:lactate permease